MLSGYLTADLSYALFMRRFPQPGTDPAERAGQEAYLAGSYFLTWSAWMGLSVAGIVLANLIPTAWGLGFAGVLCLVGILCAMANSALRLLAAGLAGAVAVAVYALPLKLNIVVAICVAVVVCYLLEKTLAGRERAQERRA